MIESGIGKKIPGKLFNGKLIKWKVGVVGTNDPVSIQMRVANLVEPAGCAVRVTGKVEPMPAPALAEGRICEELI